MLRLQHRWRDQPKIREMEPELGNLVRANGRPDPFDYSIARHNTVRYRIKTFILWAAD